jgi:hypothetical protein
MPDQPLIHDVRLSLIWTETVPDLFQNPTPAAPLAFLGRGYSYETRFEQAQNGGSLPLDLTVPWPKPSGQRFWTFYLEGAIPGAIGGREAWRHLVPLRMPVSALAQVPWLPGRVGLEAFLFPHGLALVINIEVKSNLRQGPDKGRPFTLDEALELLFVARKTGKYALQWPGEEAANLTLDPLAERCLGHLRTAAFGPHAKAAARSAIPFSVVTVVRGEGVAVGEQIVEGGPVHRSLEALSRWHEIGPDSAVPKLADTFVPILKTAEPSHRLHRHARGRAIWYPKLFTDTTPGLHKLSCYHRNLVQMSMQVESLGGLIKVTSARIQQHGLASVPQAQQECARRAAGILSRLYRGDRETYQSNSPRFQLQQDELIDPLNYIRKELTETPAPIT